MDEAILTGANLTDAYLGRADLAGANLEEAKLIKADLTGANLWKTELARADLAGAILIDARMEDAELALCLNLTQEQLDLADQKHVPTSWPPNLKFNGQPAPGTPAVPPPPA